MTAQINLKTASLGAKLSIVSAIVTIAACIYYAISSQTVAAFDPIVVTILVLAAASSLVYALAPTNAVDLLSVVSVVLLVAGLVKVAINSISTFADVLSGITMFGSQGGIEWIVATLAMIGAAIILEQISCFMKRTR